LEALSAGAFDCLPKRLSATSLEITHLEEELTSKIRAAAHSRRTRIALSSSRKPPCSAPLEAHMPPTANTIALVAIGLSTGGPKVLEQILPKFPEEFPVPILIVQHMPLGFTAPLARRLDSCSSITVKEAAQGESICPGTAYIAPAGLHMRVAPRLWGSDPVISLDDLPRNALHIPSVDELMKSVAQMFQNRSIGVIMTGMGSDGAAGITAIHKQGGLTIGQDEESCAVYGMPKACAQLGVLSHVLPLSDIPFYIMNATQYRRRA
jgi:two-component system chemotaxis response regulator CheB